MPKVSEVEIFNLIKNLGKIEQMLDDRDKRIEELEKELADAESTAKAFHEKMHEAEKRVVELETERDEAP